MFFEVIVVAYRELYDDGGNGHDFIFLSRFNGSSHDYEHNNISLIRSIALRNCWPWLLRRAYTSPVFFYRCRIEWHSQSNNMHYPRVKYKHGNMIKSQWRSRTVANFS